MFRSWVGDQFKDCIFTFLDGSRWATCDKICEKEFLDEEGSKREDEITVMEAQAVYHCQQITGQSVGEEGIMKIRMQ